MVDYIHGYDPKEQQRLIDQAEFWGDRLLLKNLELKPEAKILELGCGVGAVLGLIAQRFPGLKYAGIDLQGSQINYARHYLDSLGASHDLRIGDAKDLPWPDASFDFVLTVWVLEHVPQSLSILQEAKRVLKPNGQVRLTETDYQSLVIYPPSTDFDYFKQALCDLFKASEGQPYVGRSLGALLKTLDFADIQVEVMPFHYWQSPSDRRLQKLIAHLEEWFDEVVPQMVQALGKDKDRLRRGLDHFHTVGHNPLGSITLIIYQAIARKP